MSERSNRSRIGIGLIFILIGSLFLLSNLNLIDNSITDIIFTWQMLLIGIGLVVFASSRDFFGLVLIAIGSIFLVDKYYDFNVWSLWPLIFVFIGIQILYDARRRKQKDQENVEVKDKSGKAWSETSQDFIYSENILSSKNIRIDSNNFKGGKITSFLGGCNLDFNGSKLSNDNNILDTTNVFAGLEISVPSDWKIISEVTQIFGGYEDKRKTNNLNFDETKVLRLRGVSLFGGIKIRDF